MQTLTREEIRMIHDASMDILKHTGINFKVRKVVSRWKKAYFRGGP